MKKNLLILSSILLLIGLTIFYSRNTEKPIAAPASPKVKTRIPFKEAKYIAETKEIRSELIPQACLSQLEEIAELNEAELGQKIKDNQFHLGNECFTALQSSKLLKEFAQSPDCNLDPKIAHTIAESCMPVLFMLKSFYISEKIKDKSLKSLSDTELVAMAIRQFFTMNNKMTSKEFVENVEVFDEFHSRFPDDEGVTEAYVGYLMIAGKMSKSTEFDGRAQQLLDEASQDSFKLARLNVVNEVIKENFQAAYENLERLEQTFKGEAEIDYFKAAYYWKMNDRNNSEKFLDRAIAKGSKCRYCTPGLYLETQHKFKTAKLGDKKLFSVSIGLNFQNL